MAPRLVIIGNGIAAVRLVESLLARDADRYAITLIGDEPQPAYNRILLSPVLSGETSSDATRLHDAAWYQQHGIRLLPGERVNSVDLAGRTLTTTRQQLAWDALVFATGSLPAFPPLPGIDLPHVVGFRTMGDVEKLLALDGPTVVLGGGLSGFGALYDGLEQQVATHLLPRAKPPRFAKARHGDAGGTRGAAFLHIKD